MFVNWIENSPKPHPTDTHDCCASERIRAFLSAPLELTKPFTKMCGVKPIICQPTIRRGFGLLR